MRDYKFEELSEEARDYAIAQKGKVWAYREAVANLDYHLEMFCETLARDSYDSFLIYCFDYLRRELKELKSKSYISEVLHGARYTEDGREIVEDEINNKEKELEK